jgi:hypothetical protein
MKEEFRKSLEEGYMNYLLVHARGASKKRGTNSKILPSASLH